MTNMEIEKGKLCEDVLDHITTGGDNKEAEALSDRVEIFIRKYPGNTIVANVARTLTHAINNSVYD